MRLTFQITLAGEANPEEDTAPAERFREAAQDAADAWAEGGRATVTAVGRATSLSVTVTTVPPHRAALAASRIALALKNLAAGTLHPEHLPEAE